jgi:hypothetical protein
MFVKQIEATVADHLGPGRVPENSPGPCFSRQISMYLAKHVGGWSTTRIGRFYNGRHNTTVLHAIAKVERLRETDESIDALLEVGTAAISSAISERKRALLTRERETLIEALAARVLDRVLELRSAASGWNNRDPAAIAERSNG